MPLVPLDGVGVLERVSVLFVPLNCVGVLERVLVPLVPLNCVGVLERALLQHGHLHQRGAEFTLRQQHTACTQVYIIIILFLFF